MGKVVSEIGLRHQVVQEGTCDMGNLVTWYIDFSYNRHVT